MHYDDGKMDGFLARRHERRLRHRLLRGAGSPFHSALARAYTTFDNFFSSILAGTYPNRIFMHAAQTDRLENSLELSTLPTIWDRLIEKGVSARYYYSDVSFLWLWGTKYLPDLGPLRAVPRGRGGGDAAECRIRRTAIRQRGARDLER